MANCHEEGIALAAIDGTVTEVNEKAVLMFGFSSGQELVGRNISELISPADRERISTGIQETLADGKVRYIECALEKADGSACVSEIRTSIKRDARDNPVGLITIIRDITDRKKWEDLVHSSEEKLRNLFESASDGIFVLDLSGAYTDVNRSLLEIYGFRSKDEMIGKNCFDFVAKRDLTRARGDIKKTLQYGSVSRLEYTALRADGSEFPMEITGNLLKDASGNPAGFIGIIRDITERKKREQVAQDTREYAESIVATVREPLVVLDAEMRVISVNRSFSQTFQVSAEGIAGRLLYDLGNRQWDIPRLRELLEEILPQNTSVDDFEVEHDFETIGRKIMLLNARRLYRETDKTRMILLAIEDITKRKQAEKSIREIQERFSGLYNSSKDSIWWATADGTLTDVNDSFCRLTGYSKKELLAGKRYQDLTPEKYQELEAKLVGRVISTGEPAEYEKEYIRKDGSIVPISLTVFVVKGHEGEPIGVAAIMKDMTERKAMQEELARKEKLATLGQLAGGIGHEIRNPLATIKAASYYLNMVSKQDDPKIRKNLTTIDREVSKCERIIESLLDFARQKPLVMHNIDINNVARDVLASADIPDNIKASHKFDQNLPAIQGDTVQLQQVFANIVLNAVQAMPQGGRLTIKSQADDQERVAISFKDTGQGIPEEALGQLFEPLFTTKAKGIGLGLAIVKAIVERHGGTIEVKSRVGKGSTFTVRFPIGFQKEDWCEPET